MRNKRAGIEASRNQKTISFVIKNCNTSRPNYRHKQVPHDMPERTIIIVRLAQWRLYWCSILIPPFSLSGPATAALSVTEWMQLAPAHKHTQKKYFVQLRWELRSCWTEMNPYTRCMLHNNTIHRWLHMCCLQSCWVRDSKIRKRCRIEQKQFWFNVPMIGMFMNFKWVIVNVK